jgi:hypothetical protein
MVPVGTTRSVTHAGRVVPLSDFHPQNRRGPVRDCRARPSVLERPRAAQRASGRRRGVRGGR